MSKKQKTYTAEFKTKIVLDLLQSQSNNLTEHLKKRSTIKPVGLSINHLN